MEEEGVVREEAEEVENWVEKEKKEEELKEKEEGGETSDQSNLRPLHRWISSSADLQH